MAMPAGHISALCEGLSNIEVLAHCDAVLSGYLGSAEQGTDPGGGGRGQGSQSCRHLFLRSGDGPPGERMHRRPWGDPFLDRAGAAGGRHHGPNLLELETLCDVHLTDLAQTRAAAHQLLARGVKMVLVKHLGRAAREPGRFEMLLATPRGLSDRPSALRVCPPAGGRGDLISALMLANLQAGYDAVSAFERTNAAVDAVLLHTWQADAYELQLIAAQEAFAAPDQGAGRTAGLIFPSWAKSGRR